MLIGLVINPIAGMGGRVGLKGTDGMEILAEARRRGATPHAHERAFEALEKLPLDRIDFLTAGGAMGEEALERAGAAYRVVYRPGEATGPRDTRQACSEFEREGAELVAFVGGDGTARDVMAALDERLPVLGIPSGVKMHSGVFANTPADAGRLLAEAVTSSLPSKKAEVMDIDEEAFRENRLSASLHGHLLTPYRKGLLQGRKSVFVGSDVEEEKDEIGQYLSEVMEDHVTYLLGPGTTVAAVADHLGVSKTLLGVDIVRGGLVVSADPPEEEILEAVRGREVIIVVTPIGAQ
ncbi:MAG: ATP-NAD kinase family protein, partial [Methanomassiliicoccales archaeon]